MHSNYHHLCYFYNPRCYWGFAFENLAAENSREMDGDGKGIDANVEFCSIIKTKLGAHRIIMGAEMDCCDSTDDGRKFYVELKTSREVIVLLLICFFCSNCIWYSGLMRLFFFEFLLTLAGVPD